MLCGFLANDSVVKLSKRWCKPTSSTAKYSELLSSYRSTLAKTDSKHLGMFVLKRQCQGVQRTIISLWHPDVWLNTLGTGWQQETANKKQTQTKSQSAFQSGALAPNCWKDPDSVVTKLSPAFNDGCWRFREEHFLAAVVLAVNDRADGISGFYWPVTSYQRLLL